MLRFFKTEDRTLKRNGNDSKQPYLYNCNKYFYAMHSENLRFIIFVKTLVHVIPQCLTIRLTYVSIVVINVRNLFSNSKFPFLSSSCCLL